MLIAIPPPKTYIYMKRKIGRNPHTTPTLSLTRSQINLLIMQPCSVVIEYRGIGAINGALSRGSVVSRTMDFSM